MKKWKVTAAVALSVIVLTGLSVAQGPINRPGRGMRCLERFVELDTDNDGNVTLAEFMAVPHPKGEDYAKAMFSLKDTDEDKVLTRKEFCPGI